MYSTECPEVLGTRPCMKCDHIQHLYSTECPEVLGTRPCTKCEHIQHLYSKSVLARQPPPQKKSVLTFREQKFHFRVRSVPLPEHILDRFYPFQMFILFLLNININILYILIFSTSNNSLSLYTGCPTRYRTRHFFNNFTVSQQLGALQTHTTDAHYRHTQQTHTTDTYHRHTPQTHTTDTHHRHIPLHFSHNERTPVQISLQYLHWC
jgi:hypothetical protein